MERFPGYTLVRTEDCPEQHGTLTMLTHDVSGATVLLVENEDTNKAFGIGFGTFPSDDTGVFHILEHSVLAGSEKYPVTSPFLQLLKSSMASFLNAMTFPDKTVYPFATPNKTDFKNLMDVYLNAVFCPLAMVDKSVFEQEGWHRSADGTVSGVVYNEMQGALAAPDAQLEKMCIRDRHEPGHLYLHHGHSGRDSSLCQCLPQAADEAEELFLHPDGDPRHRPQNGQGADGPVQKRGRGEGSHA